MFPQEQNHETTFAPYDRVVKLLLPIIPKKLKPNHLTFVRLIFTPVLIVSLLLELYKVSLILFIVLALTDLFDGSIARLRNQITEWGKIWDPIADKLLIGSVVVLLLFKINLVLTILLLMFEISFILGGAFMHLNHGDVKANAWGKIKMNLQAFGGGFLILGFFLNLDILASVAEILLYCSLFFALMSMSKKGI
ncbi:MAG: CDP-diacylglycerol-glycerol-3-phosphate 3-phosphatidyltransferase [Parcubacteria group bacterium GW2011_GWC2_39_14]|nr:MAG: CDP-diacylglycerol-glycerol-3-phosphate 3-phosphatidyltransferase [Parcubacteria group bacterium GW2011_GWC2_39_14]KKR55528.1 MAG: CDP-diacylglycerol-glycerol-3-phosphate 3-phosphatidyltransferase [Parcubacteria group bacterium GW2011_GWA2_40_23]